MEPRSQLTYDAEGTDEACARLHWPGGASGVTWGHGYDLKERQPDEVQRHFNEAGINPEATALMLGAVGLSGKEAKAFVDAHKQDILMEREQMVVLFNICFEEMEKDVKRICDKEDCVRIYGQVDYDTLNERLWLILVDLRYRGDYHPTSRKYLQKHVADNNFEAFKAAIEDRDFWSSVPSDRFNRRVAFLAEEEKQPSS